MIDALSAAVASLMREVAETVVMPRFRNLAEHEIESKGVDDLVTVADRESEARLHDGLLAIDPGASIVGEEAAAADPSLLDRLRSGRHWLIDPIDGTGNFAAGREPFGLMVALVEDGEPVAGWLLDPVAGRFCQARRGGGAFVDDQPLVTRNVDPVLPVAALSMLFDESRRAELAKRATGRFAVIDMPRCAADQYPDVALGSTHVALYRRTYPWDHAAGALLVTEAGGRVLRPDGSRYRVGDARQGLLAAATPTLWDRAALAFELDRENW